MSYDATRETHTQLVLSMADRQGLDLQELMLRGTFSEAQFEHAVDRCIGCTQAAACKCLLDTAGPTLNLPDYCRNGETFSALASD